MTIRSTRRDVLGMGAATLAACTAGARSVPPFAPPDPTGSLAAVEAHVGGRVGVFAFDTASGAHLGRREDERFAMCSTFKWALAAAVLAEVDGGGLALGDRVPYGPSDLLEYAPTTRDHVREGSMTLEALATAAVVRSDNAAANLLLARVGGPAGLTGFFRLLGDPVTRLDRNEPALNTNAAGDLRDTTSPRAMVGLLERVLCGEALSPASRRRLIGWLCACETGRERLRAGLPGDWIVGDKTGTGSGGAVNDVAIAWPPRRGPILIASYFSGSASSLGSLNAAHSEVGRIVVKRLGA